MKRMILLVIGLAFLIGMSMPTNAADINVEFQWSHSVPDDIAKYTIYELSGQGGSKTGITYVMDYEYEGITEKDFTYSVPMEIPTGQHIEKCYVITASDKSANESGDSAEACGDLFVPDTTPPGSCTNFKFSFSAQ